MNPIRMLFNVFFCIAALLCFATASDAADTSLEVTLAQGSSPAGQICSQNGGSSISGSTYALKECIQKGSTTLGGGKGTFKGEARAITTTGSFSTQQDLEMHLFASGQATLTSTFRGIYEYQSAANDTFLDQITISGGTPGTFGILQVTLNIVGTVQITGNGASDSAFLQITVSSPTGSASTIFKSPTNISTQMIFEVPYIFNDNPNDFKILVEAFAGQKVDPAMGAFSATQTVDFSNTITLTSVQIKGVSNGSVISATGFNYPIAAGDPQPPTGATHSPPVAELSANLMSGVAPLVVNFNAAGSYDPDGKIVKYEWDWEGDGIYDYVSTAATVQHKYGKPGSFKPTVRVTDDAGATSVASAAITATNPLPDFSISATPPSRTVTRGSSTNYTVTVTVLNGFTGTVSFSVSGLPKGSSASFSPSSVRGSWSSTLTVKTGSTTPKGAYTLSIKGTSGSLVHSTTVTLTVQ